MKKLDIGCGTSPLPGYDGIDIKLGKRADKLEYGDATVAEVRASHVLEHFPGRQIKEVLREWVRVLEPGGLLKVAVPDFSKIAHGYVNKQQAPYFGYLMGGQTDENDFHKSMFDEESLRAALTDVGLVDVKSWTSEITDCAALAISLNLCGRKPHPFTSAGPKIKGVAAVMSMPNLAWSSNMFCSMRGLLPLGINLEKLSGVFWGQCLTECFKAHLNDGTEYILTVDYDTFFFPHDVRRLHWIMQNHPEIAALFPVQMKRECNYPLLTMLGQDGGLRLSAPEEVFTDEILPAHTGHFGLTMIRTEALRRMPKPWYKNEPDPQGFYGEGRIDEDIWFWHQLKKAGLTAFQANKVVIGHIQPMITWPDRNFKPIHQYLSECEHGGPPPGVMRW